MTEEEFFAHIDEAEQQIAQGEKYEFNNSEAMNAWLNALWLMTYTIVYAKRAKDDLAKLKRSEPAAFF